MVIPLTPWASIEAYSALGSSIIDWPGGLYHGAFLDLKVVQAASD